MHGSVRRRGHAALARFWARATALVFGVGLGLLPRPAHGYVRAQDGSGRPLHWGGREVVLSVAGLEHQPGSTELLYAAVERAALGWARATGLRFSIRVAEGAARGVAEDGVNLVLLRGADWCTGPAAKLTKCHGAEVHALTHPYSRPSQERPGEAEIIEADIELNARVLAAGGGGDSQRLEALLLHELGHLLGLDHSCQALSLGQRLDHRGERVPRCRESTPELPSTVMYPEPLGEGGGRRLQLGADDELAADTLYGESARGGRGPGSIRLRVSAGLGAAALGAAALSLLLRRRSRGLRERP